MSLSQSERRSLAEQLQANPLFEDILSGIEREATEALISADTEQRRVEMQWRVHAVRSFRADCRAALANTQPRKGAFA